MGFGTTPDPDDEKRIARSTLPDTWMAVRHSVQGYTTADDGELLRVMRTGALTVGKPIVRCRQTTRVPVPSHLGFADKYLRISHLDQKVAACNQKYPTHPEAYAFDSQDDTVCSNP